MEMSNVIDFRASCADGGDLFDKVYEHLALPDTTFLGTRITKKMILENNDLSSSDKKLVNDVVQSVEWLNTLKPETLNIPTYVTETVEYIEIAVLKVALKPDTSNRGKLKITAKLFHTLIPYPVILLVELNGELAISLADKRINQADSSKLVIEHFYNSQWLNVASLKNNECDCLNEFSLKNASNLNYFELYQDFISMLIGLEASNISGRSLAKNSLAKNCLSKNSPSEDGSSFSEKTNEDKTALLKELESLEAELASIRNKIKKESQMNTKMRLNIDARKIKQAIAAIKNQIA